MAASDLSRAVLGAMIDRAYVQRMARYNRWQNENLYGVADRLSERSGGASAAPSSARSTRRSAISCGPTSIWMSRFTDVPRPQVGIPESVSLYPDWDALEGRTRALRSKRSSTGRTPSTPSWLAGGTDLLFGRVEARGDQAALGAGHPYVQSPDPSSRPGPLHADAGRRQAVRYRSAVHAGVTAMSDTAQLEQQILADVAARRRRSRRSKQCASPRSARAARSRRS